MKDHIALVVRPSTFTVGLNSIPEAAGFAGRACHCHVLIKQAFLAEENATLCMLDAGRADINKNLLLRTCVCVCVFHRFFHYMDNGDNYDHFKIHLQYT